MRTFEAYKKADVSYQILDGIDTPIMRERERGREREREREILRFWTQGTCEKVKKMLISLGSFT